MLRTRYPYAEVGKQAAAVFAAASALCGIVVGDLTYGGSALVTDAVLYAALGGIIALLVFSSEGPRRPPSVLQAISADGVVAGILSGFFFGLAQVIAASGNTHPPSTGANVLVLFLSALAGGVIGGLVGLLLYAVRGSERLARVRVARNPKKKKSGGRKRRH